MTYINIITAKQWICLKKLKDIMVLSKIIKRHAKFNRSCQRGCTFQATKCLEAQQQHPYKTCRHQNVVMVSYTYSRPTTGILLTVLVAALAVHTGQGALKGTTAFESADANEKKNADKVLSDAAPLRRRVSKAFEVRPPHEREGYRSLLTLDVLFDILFAIKQFILGLLETVSGGSGGTTTTSLAAESPMIETQATIPPKATKTLAIRTATRLTAVAPTAQTETRLPQSEAGTKPPVRARALQEAQVENAEHGAAWLVRGGIHESRRLNEAAVGLEKSNNKQKNDDSS